MLDLDMRYLQVSDRWCVDFSLDSSQLLDARITKFSLTFRTAGNNFHRRALEGKRCELRKTVGIVRAAPPGSMEIRLGRISTGCREAFLIFSEDITRRKQIEEVALGIPRKLMRHKSRT